MKFSKKLAAIALFAAFTLPAIAGRIKIQDGSLDALKGQTDVNIEFDYSDFGVGKYDKETDYVADKIEAYNKKEAGKGDLWAKAWVADRKSRFEPSFIEKFEEYSKLTVVKKPAKYTIIIKVTFIEPGYNIYVSRKYANLNAEAWLVETANHSNVLGKVAVENNPGRTYGGNDYDTGERIAESFEYAGKYFGKFVKDQTK